MWDVPALPTRTPRVGPWVRLLTRIRLLGVVLAAALATLASATTAYAAPSPDLPPHRIPEEVTRVVQTQALPWVVAKSKDTGNVDRVATLTGVGDIHEIFAFTDTWIAGNAPQTPIESRQHWSAVLLANGQPAGVVDIAEKDGVMAPTGYGLARDLAAVLAGTGDGYYIVGTQLTGSWILRGDTLTPVDSFARKLSADPISLTEAQPKIHASVQSAVDTTRPTDMGFFLLVIVGTFVLMGFGVWWRARRSPR
ncbi:exported hypothetical protein [Nostocoides jenkinsii Ben 74]|uniref:Uncharacterized protein n=1 Tax=Nostocoides jenkinsii Ben 74 TaxID=1193518 RepID=A0A077M4X5_9MICO|nr:exported hypothetical protein [Tetrasphaera jenkinsii Ben 74]